MIALIGSARCKCVMTSHTLCLFWFRVQQTWCRGRSTLKFGYISREKTTIRKLATLVMFPFHQGGNYLQYAETFGHTACNSFAGLLRVDTLLLSDASETSSSRANRKSSVINAEGNFKLFRQKRLCLLS